MRNSPTRARCVLLLPLPLLLAAACESSRDFPTAPAPAPLTLASGHRSTRQELAANPTVIELRAPTAADPSPATMRARATATGMRPTGASYALTAGGAFSSFVEFDRFSVELNDWYIATDSAYYRDLSLSVVEFFDHPDDGDTWTLQATLPDGTLFDYPSVTYHKSWNGTTDCFVASSGPSVCNQTSVYVYSGKQIQCGQTGMWHFRMAYNGSQYDERQLKIVASVDERFVPLLAQGDPAWRSNLYDHSCTAFKLKNGLPVRVGVDCPDTAADHHTIWGRGCAITSAAMVMGYHQVSSTPAATNDWLRDHNGYAPGGMTDFGSVARYTRSLMASQGTGTPQFSFDPVNNTTTSAATLKGLICKYGPQEIAVRGTSHFVVAFGYDDARGSFLIHDPAGGVSTTLAAYGNSFNGIRLMMGPEKTVTLYSGIRFTIHSPAEVVVTDPLGRRVGLDPLTGAVYAEIPGAMADSVFLDDDITGGLAADESVKEVDVPAPTAGVYTMTVVGTATGSYSAQVTATGDVETQQARTTLLDVPTTPGEVHTYQFSYDPAAANTPIELRGGFTGGGQRTDVDELLSYSSPVARQTSLPAGTTSTRVRISYAGAIVAGTFQATLEGVDVTTEFHPVPGSAETVVVPLVAGRNVLKLSVQGVVGSRTASDQDQLVFIVK
jgi:hypothetical protein